MMDRETIIKGLEIERECVSRDCDRDCGKCDIVQERDWLLSVYDGALELLKEQEDLGSELTNAVELIRKKNKRIEELLKEQEAIPPIRESDGDPGELASWWYVCGACRRVIDYHDKFCRWCGRKVKWDADGETPIPG